MPAGFRTMKRLCFVSPDLSHTRHVVQDLRDNGIPERHIYVVAKEGTKLEDLPDSGPESDDFLAAYERGLAFGGASGLLAGLFALTLPGTGLVLGGGAVLLFTLYSAGFAALLAGLVGASLPSSRLAQFRQDIEQGRMLVLVDVPSDRIEHFEGIVRRLDPEVAVIGIEPPAPLIPRG